MFLRLSYLTQGKESFLFEQEQQYEKESLASSHHINFIERRVAQHNNITYFIFEKKDTRLIQQTIDQLC